MRRINWLKLGGIILAVSSSLMLLFEFLWIVDPPDEMRTSLVFRIVASLFGTNIAQSIIPSSIFSLEFSWTALWISQISIPRTAIVLSFLLWVALMYIRGYNKNKLTSISSFIFLFLLGLWLIVELLNSNINYLFPLRQPIHWKYLLAFILADLSSLAIIASIALIILNSKAAGEISIPKILFSFKGRTGRGMFWGIWLSIIFINFLVWRYYETLALNNKVSLISILILLLTSLICLWIGLAIQVKRWHDRNKSGWMVLINLVPVIGLFWVFVELGFLKGTAGTNKYGVPQCENIKKSLLLFLGFLCAHFLLSTLSLFSTQTLPYENYVFRLLNFIEVILLFWVIIEIVFQKKSKVHNTHGNTI